ncbi:hypothetical protein BHE74_00055320, partial [Ensete ventricosum]
VLSEVIQYTIHSSLDQTLSHCQTTVSPLARRLSFSLGEEKSLSSLCENRRSQNVAFALSTESTSKSHCPSSLGALLSLPAKSQPPPSRANRPLPPSTSVFAATLPDASHLRCISPSTPSLHTNKGVTANILPQERRHSRSLPLVPTPTPSPPARNHRNRAIVPLFLLLLRVIAHLLPPLPHCRR